jgi:hypothetical protein
LRKYLHKERLTSGDSHHSERVKSGIKLEILAFTGLSGPLVIMAWYVFRFQLEEAASR